MAATVGSPVTFSVDTNGGPSSHTFTARSFTTGNTIIGYFKWEFATASPIVSVTDTAGNSYTVIQASYGGSGEPKVALFYATNITGHASNVVSVNMGGSGDSFMRGAVTEWSGLATSSIEDGSSQSNTGTSADYTTADITTTQAGLIVLVVGDYASLSSFSGTPGNPDFTVGPTTGDSGMFYLVSGSAQTVTPGGTATGRTQWVAIAQAFKDVAGASAKAAAYYYAGVH